MKRGWTLVWIALGVVLVVRTGLRDRGVIIDSLEFGRRVLEGLDLYAPYLEDKPLHPVYPPGFGLLMAPFSVLPERLARFAWGIVQMLSLWAIGWSLCDVLRRRLPALLPRANLLLTLTAIVTSRYILRDTHGGGGNLINLALVLAAFVLAARDRSIVAGLLLGFSLAFKPTHLLMVPLLCLFGHPRAAVIAVLAAVGFTGLSLVSLGQGLTPLETWLRGSIAYAQMQDLFAPPEQGFPPFTWMNQCLRCAVARYAGTVPMDQAELVPGFVPGLGLEPAVTAWLSRIASLILLVVTASVAWVARREVPWLVAAVLCLSLLLSPISWKAHHVALIPAFFLLFARGLGGRRWVWWFVGSYALLCLLGEELTGKAFKQLQQSLYFVTAGTLALWGLCLGCARRDAGL